MKKLLSIFLAALICAAQITTVTAEDTILKNVVLHSFDFADETQTTSDASVMDKPVISGGAEYVSENGNVRFNAKSGTPTVVLNLSEAVTGESAENVISVEFDMNFGSFDGQSFTYSIAASNGEKLIDFRFEPYKSTGTGYLRVAGTDLITAGEKTVNQQLKDCIAYDGNKQDGMNADTAHFKNEINFELGTVTVSFSSNSKNGSFESTFDNTAYTDIKSLSMAMSKANTSRYSYVDNIKISQMQNVDAPNPDELVASITQAADGDLTTVDTSKMVYGGYVSVFRVTTAKDGAIVRQYTTDIADSVSVNTQGADTLEISPIYTYTDLTEEAFNTAEGVTLSDMSILGTIEDGYYDISVQKADGTLSSIYVNDKMIANAVDQGGPGRSTPRGSFCEFNNIYIENGAVNIRTCRTQADTKNGSLISAKSVKGEDIPTKMTLPVSGEPGAYIRLFNWTENMEPICGASEKINMEDINMNYSYDALRGRTVYAFGDSIVYGHNTPSKSFMQLTADDYGMNLTMLAKNGAKVVTIDNGAAEDPNEETKGNYILKQITNAPDEKPDIIVFDGYTNDAYGDKATDSFNSKGDHVNIWEHLGNVQGKDATEFDTATFCGGFEKIIYDMRQKWGDTPIVFTTIHKSGGRDWETQCKLRELSLEICAEWGVDVADIFERASLDTRDTDQMKKYIINGAGSHPNVAACREFYIPVIAKKMNEVLSIPEYKYTLPENIQDTVDLCVFAGQSNMSGRGSAADVTVCDINAGFEYKSVSKPFTLVPVAEPFGLNEDREGAIYDYNSDGTTKRTGSMVSSVVDEYYRQTNRQLVAVSASIGGTSTSEWKSNYIFDAMQRLDDAKALLAANNINVGRIFVVWCQGESDGDNNVSAETYTANTKDLFNSFKQHGAEKCFMVQIGHYRDGGTMDTRYGVIREAQSALCESDSDFIFAASLEPYKNDMKDKYHYNQATYNAVGKTVGENITKYYGVN